MGGYDGISSMIHFKSMEIDENVDFLFPNVTKTCANFAHSFRPHLFPIWILLDYIGCLRVSFGLLVTLPKPSTKIKMRKKLINVYLIVTSMQVLCKP
jgi:hypothetical protein